MLVGQAAHSGPVGGQLLASRGGQFFASAEAKEPLVEEPDPPCVGTRRLAAHHGFDLARADGQKQALQDGQVQPFIFEGEGEMSFQRGGRCVSRRQNAPSTLFTMTMMLTQSQKGSRERHSQLERVDQGGVPGARPSAG